MIRILAAVAGAALALSLSIASSQAGYGDAPWCAVISIGTGDVYWDCQYQTFDACYPNVLAGNRGFCNVNPTYKPATAAPAKHYARHRAPKRS